jgi:hypothetical protein
MAPIDPGAQTERRGEAGEELASRQNLAGRFSRPSAS